MFAVVDISVHNERGFVMGTVNLGYVLFAILCFCVGGGLGFVVGRMYQWWMQDEAPKVSIPEGYTIRRMPRKKVKQGDIKDMIGIVTNEEDIENIKQQIVGGVKNTDDAEGRVSIVALKKESQTAV